MTTTWSPWPTPYAKAAKAEGRAGGPGHGFTGFTDPVSGTQSGALMAPPTRKPETNGRRRGHLRVLPDPTD